jgi:hypothetical protein
MSADQDLFDLLMGSSKQTAPTEGSSVEAEIIRTDPDAGTPLSIRNLFTHHDAHPVVLDFALLKAFGVSWYGWDAATLWQEIQRVFQTQISEHTRAKVQTIKTLHVSPLPWQKWQVFEKIVQGLNNNIPRWDHMQAPSLEQLYAAVDMLDHIRIADFETEVKHYMAAAVLHDEVTYVPPPLDFLQLEVSQPHYHCKDCGNEDLALFHDGLCDTCTEKFSPEQGLSMKPKQELVSAGYGSNIETVLRYDPASVRVRWEQVKDKPSKDLDLGETPVDIQVAKLLIARDYMNVRRKQLAEQLTALKAWLGVS